MMGVSVSSLQSAIEVISKYSPATGNVLTSRGDSNVAVKSLIRRMSCLPALVPMRRIAAWGNSSSICSKNETFPVSDSRRYDAMVAIASARMMVAISTQEKGIVSGSMATCGVVILIGITELALMSLIFSVSNFLMLVISSSPF